MNSSPAISPLADLSRNGFKDVPKIAGVYVISWYRDGNPVPIRRILDADERGVVYIGSTKESLKKRLRKLWISIEMAYGRRTRKKYPHTFGVSLLYTSLHTVIKDNELMIFYKSFTPEEADYQEKLALFEYTRRYGEPPPLNLRIEREYLAIWDLGIFDKSRWMDELDRELREVLGL